MPAQESRDKIKHMEIQSHGKEGFSVVHHFEQKERGKYKEPKTHIMKTHGELMDHVHGETKGMGQEGECKMCGSSEESETEGQGDGE